MSPERPVRRDNTGVAPHDVLPDHYVRSADRRPLLDHLFDASAGHYDWVNHLLSLGTGVRYRRDVLRRAGHGHHRRLRIGYRAEAFGCEPGRS